MGFLNFLKYNNIVPVAVAVVLLGASGTYAAANPEAVYSATQTVLATDNTYLVGKDLAAYTPQVQILHVTEDEDYYFVAYIFSTIDVADSVWRDVEQEETLKVAKDALGPYGDLGLYVTVQLKQKIDRELARLRETQEIERKQVSSKVVATAYSGLVGAFLDTTTETLPGYTPVVEAPSIARATNTPPEREQPELPRPVQPNQPEPTEEEPEEAEEPATTTPQEPEGDTEAPVLQVLGENPARVAVGSAYTDLGAAATDNSNESLSIDYFVNGTAVENIAIDTATSGEWTVRYEATDSAGNTGFVERVVEVYVPPTPGGGGDVGEPAPTTTPTEPPVPTSTQSTPQPEPPVPSEPVVNAVEPGEGEPAATTEEQPPATP
jgi:hypothetical protein